jgi:hypothetical protein
MRWLLPLLFWPLLAAQAQTRASIVATNARGDSLFTQILFDSAKVRPETVTVIRVDTVAVSLPSGSTVGTPFGPFNSWDSTRLLTDQFNLTYGNEHAYTLPTRLTTAKVKGVRMLLAMTGGGRGNYQTLDQFDLAKWKKKQDTFLQHKPLIAQAVLEGQIIGNTVMDEPFNTGGPGNEANAWNWPAGTDTVAAVDGLCAYVKAQHPTLPTGVFNDWHLIRTKGYKVCEFFVSQYRQQKGEVRAYRDSTVAVAKRWGMKPAFSLNVLDGGTRDRDGVWDCLGTGGKGTYAPNCRMTAAQVKEWGLILGSAGCTTVMWRYDATFFANDANRIALKAVKDSLAKIPFRGCQR